ncbi:MAG: PfkB family carbohydrate kinase, partial [Natronosporangium sp.]
VLEPGATAVRATVAAARAAGVPVCYDPNVRPALLERDSAAPARIQQLVGLADIVKASNEDLAWLAPDTSDLATAARWAQHGPRLVVVTRGSAGAVALHQGYQIDCAAPLVEVVDTLGAGDAFTAGLLSSLARADALRGSTHSQTAEALRYATAVAAAVCARRGAAAPAPEAVEALVAHVGVRSRAWSQDPSSTS